MPDMIFGADVPMLQPGLSFDDGVDDIGGSR